MKTLGTAALAALVSMLGFGILYPVLIWAIATPLFHAQATGSLIERDGHVIGSGLVGQNFAGPGYLHPRPSAAGTKGYDPSATGGTNFGPTSKKWYDATRATIAAVRRENPEATGPIPADLVTSSASGIDPHISPASAAYQLARVARARRMPLGAVRAIVARDTERRTFGFLGEPRVNVLRVNLDLDVASARSSG